MFSHLNLVFTYGVFGQLHMLVIRVPKQGFARALRGVPPACLPILRAAQVGLDNLSMVRQET